MTCGRAQEFLADNKVEITLAESTRQKILNDKNALKIASEVDEIYAARGKKVVHYDLRKEHPSKEELKKVLLGPTGNLRAPTMKKGRTLLVGFEEETYKNLILN